jgi:uncharacterized protein (TIGR02001 family)
MGHKGTRMKTLKTTLAAGLLLAAATAHAGDLTSTVTLTSDYDFRGITQTTEDPALQASLDYAFADGFTVGAWASNVDFGPGFDSNAEVDLYAGYSKTLDNGFSWNAGLVHYLYLPDGDDVDFTELYVGAGYKNLSAKFWYADDFGNSGESAYYLEANYTQPLPHDFALGLHVGTSGGDFWELAGAEYEDYGISLSKPFGKFNTSLKYAFSEQFSDRVILSVSTTFPWKD